MSEPLVCAREDCDNVIHVKKTPNMKFCSDECCRVENNRRIIARYYAKRDRKRGVAKYCDVCKTTKLSRYNETDTCSSCEGQKKIERKERMRDLLGTLEWETNGVG